MEFRYFYSVDEYSNPLRLLFEKLYENESLLLDHVVKLLRIQNLWLDRTVLGISGKISNYIELDRFIIESSKGYCPITTWKVKALAELETYLIQHGRKVDYSTE